MVSKHGLQSLFRTNVRRKSAAFPRNSGLHVERLEQRWMLAQTTGLFQYDPNASYEGYTFFSPELSNNSYLIDNSGRLVHTWHSEHEPANMAYLMPDGSIWRTATLDLNQTFPWNANGVGGLVQHISWDGQILHQFRLADTSGGANSRILHHDIEVLPNGNVLMIAFDFMSSARALDNGRDPALVQAAREGDKHLIPDSIIEVQFGDDGNGQIVWEWHAQEHFVQDRFSDKLNYKADGVAAHPELIDINYVHPGVGVQADMTHANSVKYIPELDQIILSVRSFSEFWVIDHSTTWNPVNGGESAGHSGGLGGRGGDLLYRYGNPAAYGAAAQNQQQLYFQHDANWISSDLPNVAHPGSFIAYNNGAVAASGPQFSRVTEFTPPLVVTRDPTTQQITHIEYALSTDPYQTGNAAIKAWGPVTPTNLAEFPNNATSPLVTGRHFSPIISGAQRLPNGNTLVTEGVTGTIFEITPDNDVVWEYEIPLDAQGPVHQGDSIPPFAALAPALGVKENFAFKARRYALAYLAPSLLANVDLAHAATIELNAGDSPGLYVPGSNVWYLNNRSDGSIKDLISFQGPPVPTSWDPIAGDWDGDGFDNVGLYDAASDVFYLNNRVDGSISDLIIVRTPAYPDTFRPIAGDWDGDGVDTPGLYDPYSNTWYLSNTAGSWADATVFTGPQHRSPGWLPIAGDWDGDGRDSVGLYVRSTNAWYLNNRIDGSISDLITVNGPQHYRPDWRPIAGDWDTDGLDTIGLYDPQANVWYLNNQTDGSVNDMFVVRGPQHRSPSWRPIAGNWDASGLPGVPGSQIVGSAPGADDIVDGADFLNWQQHRNDPPPAVFTSPGDFNFDYAVDDADLQLWTGTFGTRPEPTIAQSLTAATIATSAPAPLPRNVTGLDAPGGPTDRFAELRDEAYASAGSLPQDPVQSPPVAGRQAAVASGSSAYYRPLARSSYRAATASSQQAVQRDHHISIAEWDEAVAQFDWIS